MPTPVDMGSEFVTVALKDQLYAIDIMSVREIRGWTTCTPLPHAPAHVLGMINLRGGILPVVDLSSRLELGRSQPGRSSVVVVADIGGRQVGLVVDAVCDIIAVGPDMLQAAPHVGVPEMQAFVTGVMCTAQGITTLLRLDSILPPELQQAA